MSGHRLRNQTGNGGRRWTADQELLVIVGIDRWTHAHLARRIGRTEKAVRRWCERHGVYASGGGMLTSGWAATVTGCSPQGLTKMARAGRIRARRIPGGRRWLFDPETAAATRCRGRR